MLCFFNSTEDVYKRQDEKVTIRDQEDDSFSKYYNPDMKRSKKKKPHAYQIKKMRKEYDELRVIEGTASVKDVLAVSREKGCLLYTSRCV